MSKTRPTELGIHLRHMRELKGLKQNEVAALAGMTPGALSKIESGETRRPEIATLTRLSEVLGLSMEMLISLVAAPSQQTMAAVTLAREAAVAFAVANGVPQWAIDSVSLIPGATPEEYYEAMKKAALGR